MGRSKKIRKRKSKNEGIYYMMEILKKRKMNEIVKKIESL